MTNAVIRARIGRLRVTRAVTNPSAAAGIRSMREQMKDLQEIMGRLVKEVKGVSKEALLVGMRPVFARSQELVPVASGKLKKSGFLVAKDTSRGPIIEVGYGKEGRPFYAAIVHENVEANHKSPTQAKYLQAAIEQQGPTVGRRVTNYISKEIFD